VPKIDEARRKAAEVNFEQARLSFKDDVAILAICYHNLAIEQEFLNDLEGALQSYLKAKTTAEDYLGEEETLSRNLDQVYEKAKTIIKLSNSNYDI
jgi:hypothetical protein